MQGRLVVAHDSAAGGLDAARLDALVDALAAGPPRRPRGGPRLLRRHRLRPRAAWAGPPPRDLATQQAAASVGQGILVHRYTEAFARHGLTVGQVLLTAEDVVRRAHYRNAQRTLYRLLEMGAVPVVNENDTVATEEIRFGDNDRLAALVAHLVHADLLVLLSDVDGHLRRATRGGPGRGCSPRCARQADLAGVALGRGGGPGVGTGGMATKVEAAPDRGVRRHPGRGRGARARWPPCCAGSRSGTSFTPSARRLPTRLLWLAYAATTRGSLHLDAGAVRAVVERRHVAAAGGRHRGRRRRSSRVIRWTFLTKRATRWPAGWSTLTRQRFRPCWAGRPPSWPASSGRRSAARSSTATTSCPAAARSEAERAVHG